MKEYVHERKLSMENTLSYQKNSLKNDAKSLDKMVLVFSQASKTSQQLVQKQQRLEKSQQKNINSMNAK